MPAIHPFVVLIAVGILAGRPLRAQDVEYRLEQAESVEFEEGEAEDEEDEIETDRDSFTPATSTAGYGWTIFEAAYSFIDNRSIPETHSYPELLVRHGVNDWLELRLGWNYEVGGAGSPVSGNVPGDLEEESEVERESRLLYGLKTWLTAEDGWRPASAVIVQGFTPTSGESHETEMSATYVFGWSTPGGAVWDTAIRYSTGSVALVNVEADPPIAKDDFNVWSPSTVWKVPVGERWKVHAEYFGVFSDGRDNETVQNFFSPGAHYLVTSNFEIGVRVGWGLGGDAPNFFSNAGMGWRF